MPTRSLTSALLHLTADAPTLPWGSSTWSQVTKIPGEPWVYDEKTDDKALSPNVKEWTVELAKKVKCFVTTIFALGSPEKREEYITKKSSDNDTAGRTAWASFVGKRSASWGINKVIDEVLEENGRSPTAVYRAMGTNDVSGRCIFASSLTILLSVRRYHTPTLRRFICCKTKLQPRSSAKTLSSTTPRCSNRRW